MLGDAGTSLLACDCRAKMLAWHLRGRAVQLKARPFVPYNRTSIHVQCSMPSQSGDILAAERKSFLKISFLQHKDVKVYVFSCGFHA